LFIFRGIFFKISLLNRREKITELSVGNGYLRSPIMEPEFHPLVRPIKNSLRKRPPLDPSFRKFE
jgi:hypothetical protein